jgi:hypothetical protein
MNSKIFHSLTVFMAGCGLAAMLTACSDDKDSNPQLIQPSGFTLNTPAYVNETVDLETTSELQLSWSQPKYTADNAPLLVTYEIQVSPTNSFNVSTEQAAADESGATVADYAALTRTTTKCTYTLLSADLDKALMQIKKWSLAEMPGEQTIFLRINAFIDENSTRLSNIISNAIELKVSPYYIELKDAAPIMWFLVGNNILDGAWSNKPGESSMPMFVQSDFAYDKATGTGEITYLNYFNTDGWKIQPESFDWNYGFMSSKEANGAVYRDGMSDDYGNIWCEPEGYYLVTVNTANNTCTINKQDITPSIYSQICMAGSFNEWGDTNMTPANKSGENHVWVYTMEVPAGETVQMKFKLAGSWDTNWGYGSADGEVNTCGKCTNGGKNIGVAEGTWIIAFNDITGEFSIIPKE